MATKKSSFSDLVSDEKSNKNKKFNKKILVLVLVLLLLIVALAGGGYFFMNRQAQKDESPDGKLVANQIQDLIDEVGEKMELPKGETPTIATVTDVTKLSDQEFFKNAQNGDRVLIFAKSKKAILYRPTTKKIIDFSPVNLNPDSQGVAQQSADSPADITPNVSIGPTEAAVKFKVVVLNSTKEAGLARKGADLIDEKAAEVIKTSNATGEYDTTTISSVVKGKVIADKDLKGLVSGFTKVTPLVSNLPDEETVPTGADIVIILGSDFSQNY